MAAVASERPVRPSGPARLAAFVQRQGALVALVVLFVFGALRYTGFAEKYNIYQLLNDNSTYGLIALGMTFVIMTGGIDLSVGSVIALASVVSAKASGSGLLGGLAAGVAVGAAIGLVNGFCVARLRIQPFIVTLAMLLFARGAALQLGHSATVSASSTSGFTDLGNGTVFGGVPYPVVLLGVAFLLGAIALRYTPFGRHVLAVGGNEEASRLMGLSVDRIKLAVYVLSGALAGLAGVVFASQHYSGDPSTGLGWELSAIAAVVVGGTLLTGGVGSIWSTLVGVLLLGLVLNVENFENGEGLISLSKYWQDVIRGAFLLVVVLLQTRLTRRAVTVPRS